jgi:ADP-ribose pyrophosphatase YjhB (NUDIX family)
MAEKWELVDINKRKTGVIHERGNEDSIPTGMYHLVVEVWTKNYKGEILLTPRHPDKNYGLLWECSGGSVICGETSIVAAKRELLEETGIDADIGALVYLGDTIRRNYIADTYLYTLNEDDIQLKLQAEEVVDVMWVVIEQMESKKEIIVDGVWDRYCQFKRKIQSI